jgi:hypothetical protein
VPQSNNAAATGGAGSPTQAVQLFYQYVQAHDFGDARNLWSASMQANYPPDYYINQRFANTNSFAIHQLRLVSQSGNYASVYIDITEYKSGATYHWYGTWDLVKSGSGWVLNAPHLSGGQTA